MKELLFRIAQSLVDQPEKVEVTEVQGSQCSVIKLKVTKSDIGKIIGKQGRTVQAIRTILQAGSSKLSRRVMLEIIEEKDKPFQIAGERPRQAIAIEVKRKPSSFAQHSTWNAI